MRRQFSLIIGLVLLLLPTATHTAEVDTKEAVEKAIVKVTEEAAKKAALTARRPDEWKGPTRVRFFVFVLNVDDVDDAAQNFTTNFYIRLRWHDDRLVNQHDFLHTKSDSICIVDTFIF